MQLLIVSLTTIYLTAVVFAPPIPEIEWLRFDDIILIVAMLVAILARLKSRQAVRSKFVTKTAVYMYVLLLIIVISTLIAGFNVEYEYSGLIKEVLRLVKYAMAAFLALSIVNVKHKKFVTNWIILLGVLVVLTQIAQFLGDYQFNKAFARFYGSGHHFGRAISTATRQSGTFYAGGPFGNPNVATSFLIVTFILSISFAFRGHRNLTNNQYTPNFQRVMYIAATILLFAGILLADSRAAFVTAIIIATFFFLVDRNEKERIFLLLVGLIPLTLMILFSPIVTNKSFIVDHIADGFNSGGSIALKMGFFQNGITQLYENQYWLGFGPNGGPRVDFEMGYFVIWYGIAGLLFFLVFWSGMLIIVVRSKEGFHDWQVVFALLIASILLAFSQSLFLTVRAFPIATIVVMLNVISDERLESDAPAMSSMTIGSPVKLSPRQPT